MPRTTLQSIHERNSSKLRNSQQQDKDSLDEVGSTTDRKVKDVSGIHPRRFERHKEVDFPNQNRRRYSSRMPAESLISRILARARSSPENCLTQSESFSELWIVLSNIYGELLLIIIMAFCLVEVMDTPVPLLSLQGIFMTYIYVGSIAVIIGIYFWILINNCSNLKDSSMRIDNKNIRGQSISKFGSLKKAHISWTKSTTSNFYIRIGAIIFGSATLIFSGLEMAMHLTMQEDSSCLNEIVFIHPLLHGLFTFLQMHFLFVNSQVLVERFGSVARFGFTHLAATNIAVWLRLVIWDSALDWTYSIYLSQEEAHQTSSAPLNLRLLSYSLKNYKKGLPDEQSLESDKISKLYYQPISQEQILRVVALQDCLSDSSLGQLWVSSQLYFYSLIIHFSLIAAAVTFVMGRNIGQRCCYSHKHEFHVERTRGHNQASCEESNKGFFIGILCLVTGIVVILIFLVVRDNPDFSTTTLSCLTSGTLIFILSLSSLITVTGLFHIRKMSIVLIKTQMTLDSLLMNISLFGIQLYSVCTIIACLSFLNWKEDDDVEYQGRAIMTLSVSTLQLIQSYAQSTLMAETSRRSCITRHQIMRNPASQAITFLLFSNTVLWLYDIIIMQNWFSQEIQFKFYGILAWGVIFRIGLPLLIFYRFHSCILLLDAWNECYRTPRGDNTLTCQCGKTRGSQIDLRNYSMGMMIP